MITISIDRNKKDKYNYTLTVKGHAHAGEYGKDIICSAVSILTYTIAQNIRDAYLFGYLAKAPKIALEEGNSKLGYKCIPQRDEAVLGAILAVICGFKLLATNYPEYVSLNLFGKPYKA